MMNKNPNFWHIVGLLVVALSSAWAFSSTINARITRVEEQVRVATENYDRVANKIDQMQLDIRQILVNLQRKADLPGADPR